MDKKSSVIKKRYHMIGIGGIGMGAIASLLLDQGHIVTGSDIKENNMTALLRTKGIDIRIGHRAENVPDADVAVYSTAIQKSNIERVTAQAKGIPLMQRAKCLAELMNESKAVTVVGSHGKTTTSSMIAQVLMKAGLEPTIAIGGISNENSDNASLGQSSYFVAELDESDGSFLYFAPYLSVITNIDKEHMDYYKDFDRLIAAYRQFIQKVKKDGLIWACGEDQLLKSLLIESQRDFKLYGCDQGNDLWATNIQRNPFSSSFECLNQGEVIGALHLPVPGHHNVLNALAAIGIGLTLKIPFKTIREALEGYQGVRRRFQVIGRVNDILVVDDYAHHPSEIKAVLSAAQNVQAKRLIAVFQPHRYTRFSSLSDEFRESLKQCDHLVITDIYAASEPAIPYVSAENFTFMMKQDFDKPCEYIPKSQLKDYLLGLAKEGDLFLSLGAGDISSIFHHFVQSLSARFESYV